MKNHVKLISMVCLSLGLSLMMKAQPIFTAELSQEYKAWTMKGDQAFIPGAHTLGEIPNPYKINVTSPDQLKKSFPALEKAAPSFDMRLTGGVTSIKDQGNCGSCWAFAALGSVESSWLINGRGYFDLSEDNLNTCHLPFLAAPCLGGNRYIASAYLLRGSGPLAESDDPYSDMNYSVDCPSGFAPQGIVTSAYFLPPDAEIIKEYIQQYGALATNFYYSESAYNPDDYTYYYPESVGTNHAVILVGWDDNKVTAGGTGAWIVKNSWGTWWGENGYFYIAYQDANINSTVTLFKDYIENTPDSKVETYSETGWLGASYGFGNGTDDALVKFVAKGNTELSRIGTYTTYPGTSVSFEVYDHFDGYESLSGLLGSIPAQTCTFTGYHSFELPAAISIAAGNDYFVKVSYSSSDYTTVTCEVVIENYSTPEISKGVFWIKDSTMTAWYSLDNYDVDPCIYAYTTADTLAPYINITFPNGGEVIQQGLSGVLWSSNATSGYVNIDLSQDNGATWKVLADSITDSGSFGWNVTEPISENCVIRITDTDGFPSDVSDAVFTIVPNGTLVSDSLALVALYNATGGSAWPNQENWLQGPVSTWRGVTVENGGVTNLYLPHNNLTGPLPAEIGNLSHLRGLFLENNNLNDTIPEEIGKLKELQNLTLSYNQFSGSISGIYSLTNLEMLNLNNNVSLSIGLERISELKKLRYLYLASTNLYDSLPSSLFELPELHGLYLADNSLAGSIPVEIGRATKLTQIDLSNNRLSGAVPDSINQTSLQSIILNDNQLSELPVLNGLNDLQFLNIVNNRFSFEDIEPNIGIANTFLYYQQANIGSPLHVDVEKGGSYTLSITTGGEHNQYFWVKDGSGVIPGATNNTYLIENFDFPDVGVYYCMVINTVAPALTLNSEPISIDISGVPDLGTVGYTEVFSTNSSTANRRALPVTMTEDGTITSISVYHNGGKGKGLLGIYNTLNGKPNQRLAISQPTNVNATGGWQTFDLNSPVAVSGGQTIWLAWVFENTVSLKYTYIGTGIPGRAQSSANYSAGMPEIFGTSSISNIIYSVYATYLKSGSQPELPGAPTDLSASPVSTSEIFLNWTDNADNESGFEIERSLMPDAGFERIDTTGTNDTSFVDTGLEPGETYYYKVRAYNSQGYSAYTPVDSATTLSSGQTTGTVGYTQVFSSNSGAANRRALPVTMTEDGTITSISVYHNGGKGKALLAVYNTLNGKPNQRLAISQPIDVTSAQGWQIFDLISPVAVSNGQTIWLAWVFENTVSMKYTSGAPGRAQSAANYTGGMPETFGSSSISNSIYSVYATYLKSGSQPELPGAPSDLNASAVSTSEIILNWVDNANNESGFEIERSLAPDTAFVQVDTIGADRTSFTDVGLEPGATYNYRVRAYNLQGYSAYTAVVTATTFTSGQTSGTVGYTQVFSSNSGAANRRALPVTMTENGTITSISVYHNGGKGKALLAVYNTLNGKPNQRLAISQPTNVNTAQGWQTFDLISPVNVSNGQTIWLAWVFENTVSMKYTSGTPGRAQSAANYSTGMPVTFGSSSISNSIYSVYATYTKSSLKSSAQTDAAIPDMDQLPKMSLNVYPTVVTEGFTVSLALAESQHAIIRVYDITGSVVMDIWNGQLEKGENRFEINDLSILQGKLTSKMLLIQVITNKTTETQKIILNN